MLKTALLCCAAASGQKSIRGHMCTHHEELYKNKNTVDGEVVQQKFAWKKKRLLSSHHVPLNQKKIVLPGSINSMVSHGMSCIGAP